MKKYQIMSGWGSGGRSSCSVTPCPVPAASPNVTQNGIWGFFSLFVYFVQVRAQAAFLEVSVCATVGGGQTLRDKEFAGI